MARLRTTHNVAAVLATMLSPPVRPWYGLKLADEAGVGSATIYAILTRLERAGFVRGTWEDIDPSIAGRPRRRLYELTSDGATAAHEMVEEYAKQLERAPRLLPWLPQPETRLG